MSDRPIIMARANGQGVAVSPESYLGSSFNAYRSAVASVGARFVPNLKANVLAIDRLPRLQVVLEEAGFDLAIDPELHASLVAASEEAEAVLAEAGVTIERVEEMLKERGLQLYGYQRDGVRWLAPRSSALLADEMGLGKTIQTLLAMPHEARASVVAPSAVAGTWIQECWRWRRDLNPSLLPSGKKNWRWPRASELLVTTYGSIPMPDDEILLPASGTILVADEAHALKSKAAKLNANGEWKGGTKRVAAWNGIRDAVLDSGGRVWLLTGTPLVNRPDELWRVLNAAKMAEDAFGSWPHFVSLCRGRRGRWGGTEWGQPSEDLAVELQKVMLRRERATVLPDLPKKQRQIRTVEITDPEAIQLADDFVEALGEVGMTVEDLADLTGLASEQRKVVFEHLSRVRAALAAAKIPGLAAAVEEYEEEEVPLVVFSAHLAPLEMLAARPGWGLIVGDVSSEDRTRFVQDFQEGRLRGIACSFGAGGVGITLTRASHCITVDLPWTPALLQQAEDRLCRIGQEADSVHNLILAADHPVDERVAEVQIEKARLIEATVEAAAVERPNVDDTQAEEAKRLAEMAERTRDASERAARERAEKDAQRAEQERLRGQRRLGMFRPDPNGQSEDGRFRAPKDAIEAHAARGLVMLSMMDDDRASEQNDRGFSKLDTDFGNNLAEQLVNYGQLSNNQWVYAVRLARRYRRQVGEPPEES